MKPLQATIDERKKHQNGDLNGSSHSSTNRQANNNTVFLKSIYGRVLQNVTNTPLTNIPKAGSASISHIEIIPGICISKCTQMYYVCIYCIYSKSNDH